MKTLIVEDDFTSRLLLQEILQEHGTVHIAVNGKEAIDAVRAAMDNGRPYDLICLDILMPEMPGDEALTAIRTMEQERGILSSQGARIFMTTAMEEMKNVIESFQGLCDAYLFKPVDNATLRRQLRAFALLA